MNGANWWVHAACTEKVAVFNVNPKRGFDAIAAAGVLPDFTGVLVHDAFASYDKFDQVSAHQLCGAHLLRELQAVTDFHTTHPGYATEALIAIDDATKSHGTCPAGVLTDNRQLLLTAAVIGSGDHGPPGKVGNKNRALARRIHRRQDDYLRFATDPQVPLTNNQAERDIRPLKTRIKISGALRSPAGATAFATIRSYLATTTKNAVNTLNALTTTWNSTPWPTT